MMTMLLHILFGVVWATVILSTGGLVALAIPIWRYRGIRVATVVFVSLVVAWGGVATLVLLELLGRQA